MSAYHAQAVEPNVEPGAGLRLAKGVTSSSLETATWRWLRTRTPDVLTN